MRAIISVSDKTGAVDFAKGLSELGYEIISTGGTFKTLSGAGVKVRGISEITGFPEIMDGRVKTLHPAVHGGILARRSEPQHMKQARENGIGMIDLVAVNLYPFYETVSKPGVSLEEAVENIDIGGPTMIRSAAKNFHDVIILVSPADYAPVLEKLRAGKVDEAERKRLSQKAFQHVAYYDTMISQYLGQDMAGFPDELTVAMSKRYSLRYGENPHQSAAFYAEPQVVPGRGTGITWAQTLGGKELSFNNILDADAAWAVVTDFAAPTAAVIKHTNPCGLASNPDMVKAYQLALSGDPVAAYGGIVAINRPMSKACADEIGHTFYEIVIAPDYEPDALARLQRKKDLRILKPSLPPSYGVSHEGYLDFRRVRGGFLVQTSDSLAEDAVQLRTVTKRAPTKEEISDLLFAFRVVKHVKSNAIVLAKDKTLLGMGAGQPSRIVSAKIAGERAGDKSKGSVLASDAMFPFPDVVEAAVAMGVTAIIQPGGSIRDEDSIKAADEHGLAMVFTGERHFRH